MWIYRQVDLARRGATLLLVVDACKGHQQHGAIGRLNADVDQLTGGRTVGEFLSDGCHVDVTARLADLQPPYEYVHGHLP